MIAGWRKWAAALALMIAGLASSAPAAFADGEALCNQTSFILYAAIAFPGDGEMISEGWTRLRPGECRTVLPAPLKPGEYFIYAHSSPAHRGGIREWSGPTPLCVDSQKSFSVSALANCETLGLESRNFHVIDGNPPEGRTTTFTETGEYGDRAKEAGLQRLLIDNGLSVRSVDGYAGRSTRTAIRAYMRRMGLKTQPDDADLIDMLEKSAEAQKKKAGLQVCNRTQHDVWTALARQRNKLWDSRGWWSLAPGACAQLVDDSLGRRDRLYLYAGLIDKDGEHGLKQTDETFCVADVRFSIPGRHDCLKRGYLEARFAKVKVDTNGLTTVELQRDDFNIRPLHAAFAGKS